MLRHHRLLELYLTEALGLPWDSVHVEAERLEHVLSEELEAALDRALGYPDTDPHGDPIPGPDLSLPAETCRALLELEPGRRRRDLPRARRRPALLRYLASAGLVPEARRADGRQGPVRRPGVTLDVDGIQQSLGVAVAERIRVGPA